MTVETCQSCLKRWVRTVRPSRPDRPRPGNFKHPSLGSNGVNTRGPSGYKSRTVRDLRQYCPDWSPGPSVVQIYKNTQSLSKNELDTCGLSALHGRTVRTIIQRLTRNQPSLVRTANGPALRPGRSAVQSNKVASEEDSLRTLWGITDSPPARPGRAAHPRLCKFQTWFDRTFNSRDLKRC